MSSTQNYIDKQSSLNQVPRDVIEIDFAGDGTDLYYFTDQQDTAVPSGAASVTQYGTIKFGSLSSVSQDLKPEAAKSSIGVISFSLGNFNNDFSALLKAKYDSGFSLKGKRVRHYRGFEGLAWADYTLLQTQVIEQATHSFGEYGIKCKDIQREEKKDLFIKKLTNLRSDYTAGDSTLDVFSTDGFEACEHGASYTDAPGQTVYYIRISLDNGFNILRATGKNAVQFTGVTGGVLGSVDADIRTDDSVTSDQQPLVEEHIYLEMPAPKLAHALYTGKIIGQSGVLPSPWHLGMDAQWVDTDSFTNIGADLFNPANDDGFVLRFEGLEKIEGKKFIEKEILLPSSTITPVQSDGSLKLTRIDPILSDGSYDFVLNESNIIKASALTHDYAAVRNIVAVDWNYESSLEDFTRTEVLVDAASVDLYKISDPLSLSFKGISGNRHTQSNLYDIYDRLRDRYAGEPLLISVEAFLTMPDLELGNVARVQLSGLQDYLNGTTLDRSFEVQNIKANGRKGTVSLKLFASGSKAGSINRATVSRVIDASWYSSQGTNIETTFAAYITDIGGVLHLDTNGATFAGTADFNAAGSIFYVTKPFIIDSGITLNITGNVQLRHLDSLQINGTVNGVGGNISGGAVGVTKAQGGGSTYGGDIYSTDVAPVSGTLKTLPNYDVKWNGSSLTGLPTRLDGINGGAGGDLNYSDIWSSRTDVSAGGAGGIGGAGLMFVGLSVSFGASGSINLSGTAGTDGVATNDPLNEYFPNFYWAGGTGAGGAPGMWLTVLDGSSASNSATDSNLVALQGDCSPPNPSATVDDYSVALATSSNPISSYYRGYSAGSRTSSNRRSIYLQDLSVPAPALLPTKVESVTNLKLASDEAELLRLKDGTLAPQLAATWTNPTSQFFVGCRIEYKKSSDTQWISILGLTSVNTVKHSIPFVEEGVNYDLRIATKSRVGTYGAWVYQYNHTVVGKTSPPPNVTGFIAAQSGENTVFKWDNSGIIDSGGFEIRYAVQGNADWNSAKELTKAAKGTELTSKSIVPGAYTFFIRERDNGGRYSNVAATYDLVVSTGFDVIFNNEEHPAWLGHKKGFSVQNNALIPTATDEAAYTTDEYDLGFNDVVRVWASVSGSLSDVTAKTNRGLLSDPVTEVIDRGLLSEAVTGTVDLGGLGYGVGGEAANIIYETATRKEGEYHRGADEIIDRGLLSEPVTTIVDRGLLSEPVTKINDNGSLVKFKPWTIGDIEFRHISHRVRCLPNETGALPAILNFAPTLDLYERKEKHTGLAIAAGGSRFNFDKPFHLPPKVYPKVISDSVLFVIPTNVDKTGFDIKGWDISGTSVGVSTPNEFEFEAIGV